MQEDSYSNSATDTEQEPEWDYFYEHPSFVEEASSTVSDYVDAEDGSYRARIFSSTPCSPGQNLVSKPHVFFDDLEDTDRMRDSKNDAEGIKENEICGK